jgi:flagellar motor switch protein FliG
MALSGREKATILLSILGAETASRVLRYLPNEIADLIAAGINHLPTPSPEILTEVMGEYQSFVAFPEAPPAPTQLPSRTRRNYSFLMYERPQTVAFLISLLSPEEKNDALQAVPRERALIEELLVNLKTNSLRPKLEENLRKIYAGRLF